MKGLKVNIKKIEPKATGSSIVTGLTLIVLITIGLCLLPIFLVFWVFGVIINLCTPNKKIESVNHSKTINTGTDLKINYRWLSVEVMPDYLYKYFDTQPLTIFNSQPKLDFFNGYFTDFIVERDDGVFVQKVIHVPNKKEIEALPLYFFKYETQEIEEIKDLKGYEISEKGTSDDFMISAIGRESGDEIQIRLRKE